MLLKLQITIRVAKSKDKNVAATIWVCADCGEPPRLAQTHAGLVWLMEIWYRDVMRR